ncbi:MAG: amidohydrolase family protein, partial [candidate division WOR-3 bacterium]
MRGGRIANVFSGEVYPADVLILDDEIVSVGESYDQAQETIDCTGLTIVPGLIDGHLHIESTLLHPARFADLVVGHGTTSVVCDPHELANILGEPGLEFMLKATTGLPVDVFFMLPSCVPSTRLETNGAELPLSSLAKFMAEPRVLGLGEFMDFPSIMSGGQLALKKVELALRARKRVDGHAPGLRGGGLMAYATAGVGSDHECTTREDAREKLRAGLYLMIREGTSARNLGSLLPLVNAANSRRVMLVSDDIQANHLIHDGHLDALLRRAVANGLDSMSAVQMVTINVAEYFGLGRRGAIAPGYLADLVVVDDLERFQVRVVVKSGKKVFANGRPLAKSKPCLDRRALKTMNLAKLSAQSLALPARGGMVRVIRIVPNQIVTSAWETAPKVEHGMVVADLERDILKLAVI